MIEGCVCSHVRGEAYGGMAFDWPCWMHNITDDGDGFWLHPIDGGAVTVIIQSEQHDDN